MVTRISLLRRDAGEKKLVGAILKAAKRRERFRLWNNGTTSECRGCDDSLPKIKVHSKLCMGKQKEFDDHELTIGHPEARCVTSKYGRPASKP